MSLSFLTKTSGRFNRNLIDVKASYSVHGDDIIAQHSTSPPASVQTPYGAYAGPTTSMPPTRMIGSKKPNSFRKTISLVSISDQNRPTTSKATGVQYEIITQLVVSLEIGHCSIAIVAEAIKEQIAYPVVLLDTKGYRMIECATTKSTEFWRSNRKILAASQAVYDKPKGSFSGVFDVVEPKVDILETKEETPHPKRLRLSRGTGDCKEKKSTLLKYVSSAFECVVCKSLMYKPQFVSCCNRIVGCYNCVSHWIDEHGCCPHCSLEDCTRMDFKGVDDLLVYARKLCGDSTDINFSDSDSEFEFPRVSFKRT